MIWLTFHDVTYFVTSSQNSALELVLYSRIQLVARYYCSSAQRIWFATNLCKCLPHQILAASFKIRPAIASLLPSSGKISSDPSQFARRSLLADFGNWRRRRRRRLCLRDPS